MHRTNVSTKDMLYDFIVENKIASEEETILVIDICGWSEETLMDIIFARTGLRSIEQCKDDGNYYMSDELLECFGLEDECDDEVGD